MLELWNRLGRGARLRLGAGAVLILALSIWLSWYFLHTDYKVLFTQLADADAATIVEQLRRLKVPYQLADDGTTVEVPADQVHETRLKLMAGGVPLAGGVGFEIFDKQGLGATEQSQRVSYQRALQGELARTIGALQDVKQARVHLVLPESTLFRRDKQEARAAITLTLRAGASLTPAQVLGIQRLTAASVAGLDPAHVVITDQRGVTLSGADAIGQEGVSTGARLEMKRDIEEYVTRKVVRFLDGAFGPGQAIVSVDVALNFDEIRRTVQDLQPSGVRRRRQVVAGAPPTEAERDLSSDIDAVAQPSNSSTDVEYEYGRKVEQVIAAPGGITRLSVGVVIPGDLTAEKQKRVADLVRMAAGINEQRGDAVVVLPLDQVSTHAPLSADASAAPESRDVVPQARPPVASPVSRLALDRELLPWLAGAFAILVLLLFLLRAALTRARAGKPRMLSPHQREALLLEIRRTLDDGAPLGESRATS